MYLDLERVQTIARLVEILDKNLVLFPAYVIAGEIILKFNNALIPTTSSTIPFELLLTLCIRFNYKKKFDLSKPQNFIWNLRLVYLSLAILKYFIIKMQKFS